MSEEIKQKFIDAGQQHIFKYWDTLTLEQQESFIQQLSKFSDPSKYLNDVSNAIKFSSSNSGSKNYSSLPQKSCDSTIISTPEVLNGWKLKGLELIKQGKVGIILMAGGQGTRLGSSSPKGCFDVLLPSHKSLFQLQTERLLQLEKLSNSKNTITLYIMTSVPTRKPTELFFKKNKYFGMNPANIIFFNQGTLPAVDLKGEKFLVGEDKYSIIESPDGNGGLYKALYDNKILEDFKIRGIEHIHMYCVDNILVKVGDPIFIGYSAINDFNIATKVVRKLDPNEKVGLIVLDKDLNVPCVIEYSEISEKLSKEIDENDPKLLKLRAANIVNHYYKVEFLQKMTTQWISSRRFLPYHIAKKKIPCIDTDLNKFIKPEEINGIKMEQFIFDVFPSVELDKFGCLEVNRIDEFSPLKNAAGSKADSPEICRLNCLKRSTKWVLSEGGKLDNENSLLEVSPLTSYFGEGLEKVEGVIFKNDDII